MICVDQNGQAVEISVADQMWLDDSYFKEKQLRLGTDAPRVALAYRVSTKGQVDHDDIPMQKIDCRKFAQKQGWRVVKEVAEKGVSGSKVSASKRDAIQQLKEEAANGEFDILLVYIDQETFEKANDIISRRSAKTAQDRRIAHTSQNPTLLAGIVYCAHCGAKMSGFMHTDRYKLADGSIREKVQPKYNCFQRGQRNKGGRDCDGQALYLAERVDAIVLKIVEEVFEQIRDTPYSQVAENRIRQESNLQKTKRAAAEKKIKAAQHALERFEGEILKCLDGTSSFTEDMIAKQIRRYQQELDDAKAEYAELQNARLNEAAEIRKLRTYYDDFKGWAEEFDTAPLEMKRMILSHLIDRVEVGRKYQVIVKFNMKYRQFLECTAETYNTEIGA